MSVAMSVARHGGRLQDARRMCAEPFCSRWIAAAGSSRMLDQDVAALWPQLDHRWIVANAGSRKVQSADSDVT